jgi:hypothetical protein
MRRSGAGIFLDLSCCERLQARVENRKNRTASRRSRKGLNLTKARIMVN